MNCGLRTFELSSPEIPVLIHLHHWITWTQSLLPEEKLPPRLEHARTWHPKQKAAHRKLLFTSKNPASTPFLDSLALLQQNSRR